MAQPAHETRLPPIAWAGIALGSLALAAAHIEISVVSPDARGIASTVPSMHWLDALGSRRGVW